MQYHVTEIQGRGEWTVCSVTTEADRIAVSCNGVHSSKRDAELALEKLLRPSDEHSTLADSLRTEIRKLGMPINRLAQAVGMPQPHLCSFMGGAGLTLATADKLCRYLGLELKR